MRALVLSMNASSDPMRIGSGRTIDAMPAIQQPRMIVISSRLVGPRIATWSPGTRPLACRAAPTARASSWISRQRINTGPASPVTDAPTNRTPVFESAASSRRSMVDIDGVVVMRQTLLAPRPSTPTTAMSERPDYRAVGSSLATDPKGDERTA